MCWCNPDPGRRSWMTFSTRSRVSPVAGGCRRAASRRPRRSGAATTPYSSASQYLRWHPLVNYQPKWRIGDFFCECSNLENDFSANVQAELNILEYLIFIRRFRIVIVGRFMVVDPRSGRLTPKQIAVLSQYLEIRAEILQIAPRCV